MPALATPLPAANGSRCRLGRRCFLDRDFAVDELAVVYPILNTIFDPIPIVAEETDSFVRCRIGELHATCATPSIAHDLEVNSAVCGFPFWAEEKFSAHNILSTQSITRAVFKIPLIRQLRAIFSILFQL